MTSVHQDIKEWKRYTQNYYGDYCSRVRENNLDPVPYHKFQDLVEEAYECCTTKKERMQFLLSNTPITERPSEAERHLAYSVDEAKKVLEEYYYQDGLQWHRKHTTDCQRLLDRLSTLPKESLVYIIHETDLIKNLRDDAYKSMKVEIYNKAVRRWNLTAKQLGILVNMICYQ